MNDASTPSDKDELETSRAPLLDHLIELRGRLIIVVLSIAIGFVICFVLADQIYGVLLAPFKSEAQRLADLRGIAQERLTLIFTAPLEYFFTKVKLAVFGGIVLSVPVLAYQIARFVGPALYKSEKQVFVPFVIGAPVLFGLGGWLAYGFVLPFVMRFALSQEASITPDLAIELLPRVSEYLTLVTTLILAFGFSFQLPVILTLLALAGFVSAKQLISGSRYAVVAIFAFAMFVTPPDPLSQIGLGTAIMALYGFSILIVMLVERRRAKEEN
jgi:sec-independent protein translocase protein TatC